MSTLQVRDVPPEVHRTIKTRAAAAGLSLSDYVLAEIVKLAQRPTLAELSARIEERGRVRLSVDPVSLVEAGRARG
jgi:plasmid stability protein